MKPEKMMLMGYGVLVVALVAFGLIMMTDPLPQYDASKVSKIPWQPYSAEKVAEARAAGKPVMIDFFAIWCSPCRRMDYEIYSRQDVADAATNFVTLRVDVSDERNAASYKVAGDYAVTGWPTVVFIGRDGKERVRLRVMGIEDHKRFIQRMKAVD